MTRYTVVWQQAAEDDLVDVWLASADRAAVTAATAMVEQELLIDAHLKGEVLHEGLLALNIPPLRVLFTLRSEDRIVEVLRIRGM